ncbi:MAG: LPP20 family lipoprotein [Candidatus Marinimicrobia bacterium]|nr:LPP20 family lipoprotein [Candidatus Neomarinimicrobiota bacterium]MCF7829475.1 LPP20 family lipoprotein [Candidatus Neomarinimicrobiota bacterium]MCF7880127.1 LPP20 family lipoprotein [Candidatus Neomarinimicrobiota bacterium]
MKRNILPAILLIFSTSLLLAQAPEWYINPQASYPADQYITGVGLDESLESAKQQAKAEIASQIQTTIQSEITDIEQEMTFEGSSTVRSDFTQKIKEITNVSISGIAYPRTEQKEGKYYVLGLLDKTRYLQDIRAQLETKESALADLDQSIQDQLQSGGILTALENYDKMTTQLNEFLGLRSIYNSLSRAPYIGDLSFSLNSVWTDIITLIRSISIQPVSGENQTAKPGEMLPEPIIVRVTYSSNDRDIPVSGLVLTFENSDGSRIDKVETDASGQASAKIIAVPGESPTAGQVEVTFASMPFPALRKNLRTKSLEITYVIDQPDYAFRIQVTGNTGDTFQKSLQQALTGMGYTIKANAPVTVKAELAIQNSREVKGFAGTQYMKEAQATISLVAVGSGDILGQAQFTGRGMSTKSPGDAETMAYERIDLTKSKLAQLFANAADNLQPVYKE